MAIPIGLPDVMEAAGRIAAHIKRTPVATSASVDDRLGAECFFKLENLQAAGAFKSRGACNVVFSLDDRDAESGVVTHSSGNHAAALARAAKRREIPCFVVMPQDAPKEKIANVESFGAKITFCEPTLAARESTAAEVQRRTGATFVHPYDDWSIIAGAGTAALELFEEVPKLDLLVAPVGGGGLLSGTAVVAAAWSFPVDVWGAEPVSADDAWQSKRKGQVVAQWAPTTQADGLRTSLGDRTWQVIDAHVSRIVLAPDTATMLWARRLSAEWDAPVEISSAVPVAALLEQGCELRGRRIGIVVTGGNADYGLAWRKT